MVVVSAFLAGSWITHWGSKHPQTADRKILYYVDPMNPAFKSEKPGIAPCGMALEPVYAGSEGGPALPGQLRPGTIRVNLEKQQLIGIKVAVVEKAPWSHTLRVLGRVIPDETRVYRINAAVNGSIEDVLPVTTGAQITKNQLLATFYSPETRSLVQTYFNITASGKTNSQGSKQAEKVDPYSTARLKQAREATRNLGLSAERDQVNYYRMSLFNLGMTEYQLDEIDRTRNIPDVLDIRAPISGFILSRNVSPGLRFDRGAEFFRIADLSRVWILADVFENEATFFQPGRRVKMELPYQKKTLYAQMSNVLPLFDPGTRTLKLRLEANNPGYALRPDMFVNVEIPVSGPPAIIIPTDAVIDSGLKKTVFIDRGKGYFEPRQVETGRSLGERVEITRGLMPGEKIVVSGNFLIDSESRMKQAAVGINGKAGRDSVCGMNIDEDRSRAAGFSKEYQGKTYFFCSNECRDEFGKTPGRYAEAAGVKGTMPPAGVKANSGMDHSAHGSKSEDRPSSHAARHDHDGMKHPASAESPVPAAETSPMRMERKHTGKTNSVNKAVPDQPPQAPASSAITPVSPVKPGMPSMSPSSPQSAPSGSLGGPLQKPPVGQGSSDFRPQPPGNPTLSAPRGENLDSATKLRNQRIMRRQPPGMITPAVPGDSILPASEKNRGTSPDGKTVQMEQRMKTTDDGQNHD